MTDSAVKVSVTSANVSESAMSVKQFPSFLNDVPSSIIIAVRRGPSSLMAMLEDPSRETSDTRRTKQASIDPGNGLVQTSPALAGASSLPHCRVHKALV